MNAPAEIRTERLLLRKPAAEDAAAMFANYAGDESVGRYLAWRIHQSIDDTHAFLKLSDVEWQRWPAGPYLLCYGPDQTVIGSTGLLFDSPHCASTGYVIGRAWWGQGFATEATRAMVDLARQHHVDRLLAYCHPEHVVSQRVLEKAGFVRDEILSEFCEFPNLEPGVRQRVVRYICQSSG